MTSITPWRLPGMARHADRAAPKELGGHPVIASRFAFRLPVGQITSLYRKQRPTKSTPFREKYHASVFQNIMIVSAHPASIRRGVSRSSRTLEAGSGGRENAQRAARAWTKASLADERSRVFLIPRRWGQVGE